MNRKRNKMGKLDDLLQLDYIALKIAIDMADQFSPGFCGNVMVENFAGIVKKHINALRLEQETKAAELRDHFAGLAMQSLYLSGVGWETTGKERDEGSLALIKELACDAYQLADEMLKARGGVYE